MNCQINFKTKYKERRKKEREGKEIPMLNVKINETFSKRGSYVYTYSHIDNFLCMNMYMMQS